MKKRQILSAAMVLLALFVLLPIHYSPTDNGTNPWYTYFSVALGMGGIEFGLSALLTILAACIGLGAARWRMAAAGGLLLTAGGGMLLFPLLYYGDNHDMLSLDWIVIALQLTIGLLALLLAVHKAYWKALRR